MDNKKIAVGFEYEDYVILLDRKTKTEINKINIPSKVGEIWSMKEVSDRTKKQHIFLKDKT